MIEIENRETIRDSRLGLLKSDRRMMLQYAVTTTLADSSSLDDAVSNLLQAFCILGGWEFGEILVVNQENNLLRSAGHWKAPKFGERKIEMLSQRFFFNRGDEIPGSVWATNKPVWLTGMVEDNNLPYTTAMSREGMRSIIGSPIRNQHEVIGVIMLFSLSIRNPDAEFLELLKSIGSQIGEFFRRRWAEEALKQSEQRFRALIENSSDAILLVGVDGRIHYITPSGQHILGYSGNDIIGKDVFEFIHPEDRKDTKSLFLSIVATPGKSFTGVYRVRHKDGSWRWMEGIGTNLMKEPAIQNFVINHRDITEYKKIEKEVLELNAGLEKLIEQRTRQLREANEELEAFSYSVAHDLRAPLRALNGFTHVLLENNTSRLDDEGRRILNVIKTNTAKMGQLIEDLLAFSRISRQELGPVSNIDMEVLIRGILDELLRDHPDETIIFEINSLPHVGCSEPMMRQVWVNLISNAVKFTRNRPERIIKIGSMFRGDQDVFFIKDNGIGFDMRFAEKIFGMFQRLHPTKAYEGTGVGLAIVKRIIFKHNGKIWAEGKMNEGATVYFSLPRKCNMAFSQSTAQ